MLKLKIVIIGLVFVTLTGCIKKPITSTTTLDLMPANTNDAGAVTAPDDAAVDDGVDDSALALALLNSLDVAVVLDNMRPATIELNDQMDKDYLSGYSFFITRRWYDRTEGTELLFTALTKYPTAEAAQSDAERLVENYDAVSVDQLGDTTFVGYDDPLHYYGSPSDPATLVYRFTYGPYMAKVEVVDTGNAFDENSVIQARLVAIAEPLAQRQYEKLVDLVQAPTTETVTNPAIEHLPMTLSGATLIGTVAVSDEEWLGVTQDFEREALAGFISGGMNRFVFDDQDDHVAEVTVLEFATAEQAQTFQAELLTEGEAAATGTEIALPDTIAAVADALEQETFTEFQAAVNNYFIDVTVFAPFAETDMEFSRAQLITTSEEVIGNFGS